MKEKRRIVFYDCTNPIWRSGINVDSKHLDEYPYVFGLLDEWFRGPLIGTDEDYTKRKWSLCDELKDWLMEQKMDYYFINPSSFGLLLFKDKETVMHFKLTWM
jgi:hypothetical protein